MTRSITLTDQDQGENLERVPPRQMSLPGDPEDMVIDEACRDLKLPAFRERFIELSPPPPGASTPPTSSSSSTSFRPNSPT